MRVYMTASQTAELSCGRTLGLKVSSDGFKGTDVVTYRLDRWVT